MKNKRAQLKIQQMAFVLIALVIFFSLVALIYLSIRLNSLKKDAALLEDAKVKELVRKLSAIPELNWRLDCNDCIDLDKALVLKNNFDAYQNFFGLDYLRFEIIYPEKANTECKTGNYPNCNSVTLIDKPNISARRAYVALCRYDSLINSEVCELGAVYAAGKTIK